MLLEVQSTLSSLLSCGWSHQIRILVGIALKICARRSWGRGAAKRGRKGERWRSKTVSEGVNKGFSLDVGNGRPAMGDSLVVAGLVT